VGNLEGKDIPKGLADVIVTDGFTGNVTLKTLEGAMRALIGRLVVAIDTDDETRAAGVALTDALDLMISELHPDSTGGALLLGVKGVCVISHGSSSAEAMVNAIRVAAEMVEIGMVGHLNDAVST
jgi:glycerol-3-phosphate acyltransferase PlsX